jgi:hypothetical protein
VARVFGTYGIILGIGGDNSKGADGTSYEGVMTYGYPSASTEAAVQASIVAAGASSSGGGRATAPITSGVNSSGCVDLANASATDGRSGRCRTGR